MLRSLTLPILLRLMMISDFIVPQPLRHRCSGRLRSPYCAEFSKNKLQSHPHRARFDRSPRREEVAQARRAEINELRAEAEDRRVERVESLDLKLGPAPLAECELARQPQVERVGARSPPCVARQI